MFPPPDLWALPGAVQTLKDIGGDLAQGISLCLIAAIPESLGDFRRALDRDLQVEQGLIIHRLCLPELENVDLTGFLKAVRPEAEQFQIQEFMQPGSPDVLLLDGFEDLQSMGQDQVLLFLRMWADHCHTHGGTHSLCLTIPACAAGTIHDPHLGTTSSRIKLRSLVGFPSALETRLLLRAASDGAGNLADFLWHEQIIASLAGSDLELAGLLSNRTLNDLSGIRCALADYAQMRSWTRAEFGKELKGWTAIPRGSLPQIPRHTRNLQLLWKQFTLYTFEYGEEVHPAGLYLLGRVDELKHRVWRAQMTLALPLIDELRIRIYDLAHENLAVTWENHDIPEIGELKYSLEQRPPLSPERRQFYERVCRARDARNNLAHMETIPLSEFAYLWEALQNLG